MSPPLLTQRWRGFRVLNLVFGVLLLSSVVGVYLAKTLGGDEKSQISRAERAIAAEQAEIRLLKAEVAHLSRPERLEALAELHLGLAPVAPARRVALTDMDRLAPKPALVQTPVAVAQ